MTTYDLARQLLAGSDVRLVQEVTICYAEQLLDEFDPAPTAVAVLSCTAMRNSPYRATCSKEDAA